MAIITVSRQFGSGGEYVCERIASKLGFRFIHKELIKYIAILLDMEEDKVHQYDEERHSTLRSIMSKYFDFDIFNDIFKTTEKDVKQAEKILFDDDYKPSFFDQYGKVEPVFDSTTFQLMMERIIVKLADETNAVIMGRGSQFILKHHPNALHIRLIAPLEDRAFWLRNRENMSEADSIQQINEIDKRKHKYIKHYYQGDINDYDNYHAVINLKKFDIEETASVISEMAKIKLEF